MMRQYDTTRSDKITNDFLARNVPFKRKVLTFGREFSRSIHPRRDHEDFKSDYINAWRRRLKQGY